jgi:hypothetical protein
MDGTHVSDIIGTSLNTKTSYLCVKMSLLMGEKLLIIDLLDILFILSMDHVHYLFGATYDVMELLLDKNVNILPTNSNRTVLIQACERNDVDMVQLFTFRTTNGI